MEKIIEIKDLKVRKIINNLNLKITKPGIYSIVGRLSSGKTTLAHSLLGFIEYDGKINVLDCNNIIDIRKNIGFLPENLDNLFISEVVRKEYEIELKNNKFKIKDIKERINEVDKLLNLGDILNKNFSILSDGEKRLSAFGLIILKKPKILILDSLFDMLDNNEVEIITNVLKSLEDTTIILLENKLDKVLFSDKLFIMDKGKVVLDGKVKDILKEENILKSLKIKLPVMADLSIKLKYYGLLDDIILDPSKMVKKIWK